MGTRRKHLGVAVYNNMIYAVGGRDDTTELSSAERYSPQTNSWQPVVAMTSRRSGVSYLGSPWYRASTFFGGNYSVKQTNWATLLKNYIFDQCTSLLMLAV